MTSIDKRAIELLAELATDLIFALGAYPNLYDEYESKERIWEEILLNDLEKVKQYLDSIGYNKNHSPEGEA